MVTQPIGEMVTAVCAGMFLINRGDSRMRSLVLVLGVGVGIFAIVPGYAQDAASGEKIFVQCKACHQIGETAKNAVGPVLNGLFGRKAGIVPAGRQLAKARSGAVGEIGSAAFRGLPDKSVLEHDPEKWVPVFREDHAQTKG